MKTFGRSMAGAMLLAVTAVAFALISEPALADAGALVVGSLTVQAGIGVAAARMAFDVLTERATAFLSRAKDGLDEAATRALEVEHTALVAQVAEAKRILEGEEVAERAKPGADGKAAADALAAERTRMADIVDIGRRSGLDEKSIDEAVRAGTAVEAFRGKAFDHLAAKSAEHKSEIAGFGTGARTQVQRDEQETRRQAAVEFVLHRADPGRVKMSDKTRAFGFQGMKLIDLARDFLESHGEKTRGLYPDEIARRAFHSTSDFPNVLLDASNKSLRAAYDVYPQTFKPFSRQVSAPDFKTMNRIQLGEMPALAKVNESGEFTRGTVTEGKETLRVLTYGKVIGITRQTIVNDDLGAFTRIPAGFGTSVATLESDLVWSIITTNAAMADGVQLFHATHANLIASGGAAPSVTTLGATRTLMRKQKGLDATTKLNIRARYLLVPVELETGVEQLLKTINYADASSNAVPQSLKNLEVIGEPRLSDNSAVIWYLAADPSQIDTIEYAYLEGNEGAYIESRMGFDVDGMETKVRLDFGCNVIDFRGFAKNPGQ